MLPLQQPLGHELASHTHCPVPLLHSWPDPQAEQLAPPVPQEPFDSDVYASHVPLVPPTQQPLGHVVASHEQTPAVLSQRPFAQDAHATPPIPHWEEDCEAEGTHVLPLQQPPAHEVASQTHCPVVLLHSCPEAHAPHDAPPAPHEVFDSEAYASQVLPLQQPFGHEVPLHTHCPLPLHCWVGAHAAHAAPPAPHDAFDSLANSSHVPALQQPEHDVPPHEHAPPEHACPEAHALQAAPPAPQSAEDCDVDGTHVLPLQQPVGQELASQTHCPVVLLHSCPEAHAPHAAPAVPHDEADCEA